MKSRNCRSGLIGLCLALLAGCATGHPSPAPTLTVSGCPVVAPCTLQATSPTRNGQLLTDQERTELAWAECAAQVDSVFQYQVTHGQTR
ncbi:Rz1-like lysis system protein LysC [Pseudomonas putida]|uniref:Rz1-like lysis system protein LysC n=1 Tax=Pseudomonas putida TaxID=303 RepID=UPI001EF81B8A|nr:Rz1-like lysis system protein LysC [Pseudomonas putida]